MGSRQHRPAAVWPTAIAGLTCGCDRSFTGNCWKYLLAECRWPATAGLSVGRPCGSRGVTRSEDALPTDRCWVVAGPFVAWSWGGVARHLGSMGNFLRACLRGAGLRASCTAGHLERTGQQDLGASESPD